MAKVTICRGAPAEQELNLRYPGAIPDLWALGQALKAKKGKVAGLNLSWAGAAAMILETWHTAHGLKNELNRILDQQPHGRGGSLRKKGTNV
mgnify:CR=1 FL=1